MFTGGTSYLFQRLKKSLDLSHVALVRMLVSIFFFCGAVSARADLADSLLLSIWIDSDSSDHKVLTRKACDSFAKLFGRNPGTLRAGAFKTVTCLDHSPGEAERSEWTLIIKANGSSTQFTVFESVESGHQLASTVTIPVFEQLNKALQDKAVSQLIAWRLLDDLPFFGVVPTYLIDQKKEFRADTGILSKEDVPKQLIFYTLARNEKKIWQPRIVAVADLTKTMVGKAVWSMVGAAGVEDEDFSTRNGFYFMRDPEGIGRHKDSIEKALRSATEKYEGTPHPPGSSRYYVGVRYGLPLRAADRLLRSPLVGAFLESRSGVLDGFRVNYDQALTTKEADDTSQSTFGWSRVQLGYGFGKQLDLAWLNWVEIMPKIGTTTLKLEQTYADENEDSISFSLRNAWSLGLELGLEYRSVKALVRGWLQYNYTPPSANSNKTRVSQVRAGLDLQRDVMQFGDRHLSVLGFVINESTDLLRSKTDDADVATISELSYQYLHLGLGLALRW